MADTKFTYNERPVVLKEFTIGGLRDVRAAFGVNPETGMWTVLAMSAHYADDDVRVFQDVADIEAQPARKALALTALASEAMSVNGMETPKEDAPPLA